MADDIPLGDYHVPPVRAGPCVAAELPCAVGSAQRVRECGPLLMRPFCPQGCKCMIAIDRRKLDNSKPDPDSAYWC